MQQIKKILRKYKDLPISVKATCWFTLCNLLLKGISFFSTPIFTRLMSESEYGLLSLFMAYEQLILIFATWELQMGAYQKGIFNFSENVKMFSSSTQCLINIITLCCFGIIFIFKEFVSKLTGMSGKLLFLMFLYLMVQPSYNCWLIRKRTSYEYKAAVIVTLTYSIINVIVPTLALSLIAKTAAIKFGFTMFSSVLFCLFFFIPNVGYWELIHNWGEVKQQWKFSLTYQAPLVLHSLSYLILGQADRVMIGNIVGKEQAAFYSVAYNIAMVVSILQSSVNQTLLPWRYKALQEKHYEDIRRTTNGLIFAIGILITAFILVAPEIVYIMFTENYYEAVWSIPPVSLSVYFMFLYTIFVNVETYFEKTAYVMYVSVSCGILNIVLNYILIGPFGYIVCGYTTLFSYIMFSIGHYYFMNKTIKEAIPGEKIFDERMIIIISIMTSLAVICGTALYSYPLLRYAMIIIGCLSAWIYRQTIMKFVRVILQK